MEDYFSKVGFFDGVDTSGINFLVRDYSADSVFYYQDDNIDIHFLVSGSCKSFKTSGFNEIYLYKLHAGDMISDAGCVALSNVEFLEDSTVLSVKFASVSHLHQALFAETLKRNEVLNTCINQNLVFDAISKVSSLLLKDINSFNLMKRYDVAAMLNIKSETLSRVLKKLSLENIVKIQDGIVSIINKQVLDEILASS